MIETRFAPYRETVEANKQKLGNNIAFYLQRYDATIKDRDQAIKKSEEYISRNLQRFTDKDLEDAYDSLQRSMNSFNVQADSFLTHAQLLEKQYVEEYGRYSRSKYDKTYALTDSSQRNTPIKSETPKNTGFWQNLIDKMTKPKNEPPKRQTRRQWGGDEPIPNTTVQSNTRSTRGSRWAEPQSPQESTTRRLWGLTDDEIRAKKLGEKISEPASVNIWTLIDNAKRLWNGWSQPKAPERPPRRRRGYTEVEQKTQENSRGTTTYTDMPPRRKRRQETRDRRQW